MCRTAYCCANKHPHGDAYDPADSNSHTNPYPNVDANANTNTHLNTDTQADFYPDSCTYAHTHGNTHADSDFNTHAHTHPETNPDPQPKGAIHPFNGHQGQPHCPLRPSYLHLPVELGLGSTRQGCSPITIQAQYNAA